IAAALMLIFSATLACAQSIVTDALQWFPPDTLAVEYSNPSTLRGLPAYQALRAHYLGRDLQELERSLARLGIHETDIDELVLGWQAKAGSSFQYEGLASGSLDPQAIAQSAAASGITPTTVQGEKAYCFAASHASTCVAILPGEIGAFGPLPLLAAMLRARNGQGPSVASDTRFTQLVDGAKSDAPIWGVAKGVAVAKWFDAWMPSEKNLKMNWSSAFQDVRALSYQVQTGSDVDLSVKLECTGAQAAASLRQLMEGLKLIQQLAWRTTNPSQPNPFANLDVESAENQVSFKLTADYAALERLGPLGH
ncbi:MAG: hypothetical protein ACRD3O_20425, partial [Terriglobia bacterium]